MPGIGVIIAEKEGARVNYVDGSLTPPALQLSLTDKVPESEDHETVTWEQYLKQKTNTNVSYSLEDISAHILKKLAEDKVITICNMLRFYIDSSGKIQFRALELLPLAEMFGLPALQYYTVSRNKSEKRESPGIATISAATGKTTAKVVKKNRRSPSKRIFGWKTLISSAAVLLLILSTITILNYAGKQSFVQVIPVSEQISERLNKKPGEIVIETPVVQADKMEILATPEEETELNFAIIPDESVVSEIPELEESNSFEEVVETEMPIESSASESANTGQVIFIELLCNERNVERLVDRIQSESYNSFTRPRGRCTQVGIYSGSVHADLNTALSIIQQKYNAQAFYE